MMKKIINNIIWICIIFFVIYVYLNNYVFEYSKKYNDLKNLSEKFTYEEMEKNKVILLEKYYFSFIFKTVCREIDETKKIIIYDCSKKEIK